MTRRTLEVPRFDPDALAGQRRRRRISQATLAARLQVHENQIHRWEKGKTPITAVDLRRVARELQVVPAQLQHPLTGPPTLADLRQLLALTRPELALRVPVKLARLECWETGLLGHPDESGPLLAAVLGTSPEAVADYERTGRLPTSIADRLARALRADPTLVKAAFITSRECAVSSVGRKPQPVFP